MSINVVYFSPNVSVKLDTLSKDDLIKFAKKQMGAMHKLKAKCAGKFTPVLIVFGFQLFLI